MSLIVGLDLGKSVDPSAWVCVERTERLPPGKITNLEFAKPIAHYRISDIRRWPLGTSYTKIVEDVAKFVERPPLPGCRLIVDATGVGRPVVEMLKRQQLPATVVPLIITAGHSVRWVKGELHIAKQHLAGAIQLLFQQRRLEIVSGLKEAPNLVKELRTFTAKVNAVTGNTSFEALHEKRDHDDIVLAAAMALWFGERPKPFGMRMHKLPGGSPGWEQRLPHIAVAVGDELNTLALDQKVLLVSIVDPEPAGKQELPVHSCCQLLDSHLIAFTDHEPSEHSVDWEDPVEPYGKCVKDLVIQKDHARRLWSFLTRKRGATPDVVLVHAPDEKRALSVAFGICDGQGWPRKQMTRVSDLDWEAVHGSKPPSPHIHTTVKAARCMVM